MFPSFPVRRRARIAGALCAALLAGPATSAAPARLAPPGAFELLREIQQVHAGPGAYHDSGRIETASGRTARFTTARDAAGAFRFEIAWEGEARQVLWRGDDGWFRLDEAVGAWWPVASPLTELAALSGGGGTESLLVPSLLAAGAGAVPAPRAAALEGPEPCGESAGASCWRLVLAWPDLESHLLVAVTGRRVLRVETRSRAGGLDAAFAAAGLL
ncbi:MAG TPA: hypothetical protein VHQ65_11095, partial [Thermoanaerobaculia bacterium]|nr:hypothetical protein [Thermoanaerobaculia bacterium]